jgi:hypothetical protein
MKHPVLSLAIGVAAALVGLLQIISVLQLREQTYRGYRTDSTRVVTEISRGGPAERAGISVGDRITRIGGVAADGSGALEAQPRARIGEMREIVVDRGGHPVTLSLTYEGLPAMDAVASLASSLTGICFLGFGLWAFVRVPRASTTLLALAGIGLGAAFVDMPYFASPTFRAVQDAALLPIAMFGFVFLLHFTLVFPAPMRVVARRFTLPVLYGPPVVVAVTFMLAKGLDGGGSSGLGSLTATLALVLVLVLFTLSAAAIVHGYVTTAPAARSAWGLNVLLVSILLGLAPIVSTAIAMVAPRVALPGSENYDVVWVLIPFALARAAVRNAQATAA